MAPTWIRGAKNYKKNTFFIYRSRIIECSPLCTRSMCLLLLARCCWLTTLADSADDRCKSDAVSRYIFICANVYACRWNHVQVFGRNCKIHIVVLQRLSLSLQILGTLNGAFWSWNWYKIVISGFRICYFQQLNCIKIVLHLYLEIMCMHFILSSHHISWPICNHICHKKFAL